MRNLYWIFPLLAVTATAIGAVPVPSPTHSSADVWPAFTKQAVTAGDFAGWRDALADALRTEITSAHASQVNLPSAATALAQWIFLRDVLEGDADVLTKLAAHDGGNEFLVWLLANREALDNYNSIIPIFLKKGRREHGLDGWREIWRTCPESREPGLWRRVAAACAIAFAEPRGSTTPRERFDFYRGSRAAGQLVPYFDRAPLFELVLTVHGSGCENDDLEWAQDVTPKDRKAQNVIGNYGHSLVAYRSDNYRGQTVQGPEYYDRKPADLGTAMEYGGVCGMISHMNSAVTNAHGVPAFTVGQPGHCAYVWKSDDKTWSGGNFISGWADTHDSHQQPFWLSQYSANINLVSAAVETQGFAEAERLRALAGIWREKDVWQACEVLAAATAANPLDYGAWNDRIDAMLAWKGATPAAWQTLWAELLKAFPKFPVAMNELLARFDTNQLLANCPDSEKVCYAATAARALTGVPASEQWDLIYPVWKPWLARQLIALGVPEQRASAIVEGNVSEAAADGWVQVPEVKRPNIESLFTTLLPIVEQNNTLYKSTATAWLTLAAENEAANARAGEFFQSRLAVATDLREIAVLADSLLTATRSRADARADLVAIIRKRISSVNKPDPANVDSLLALLSKHDFRAAGQIGEWKGDQLAGGGEQTLEWEFTRPAELRPDEISLALQFRWTAGTPLTVKTVRLFEDGKELGSDPGGRTADSSLQPAVVILFLPKPKPGAKYTVRATVAGGTDSAGVVLSHAEAAATFNNDEWVRIGGWGGKEIKAATEITSGWYELEFDATKYLRQPGPAFVVFKYDSYVSPQVMSVHLFVDDREVASDLHSCNPISGANTTYALCLPPNLKSDTRVTVRALFTYADGWGSVYVRKQAE
jgi:hypothetical protein